MHFSTGIKSLTTAAYVVALGALLSTTVNATPIVHDGAIFKASNGVRFSFIHTSTGGGRGSIIRGNTVSPSDGSQIVGDVQYSWDTVGAGLGPGTTITFDRGPTTVFNDGIFELDLWTSSSVLTVGAENSAAHGSIGGVNVTHDIGGTINFTISQIGGGNPGAILSDTFNFDVNMVMGPINGIGSAGGSPESFNTYLWGDTGAFTADRCDAGDCSDIVAKFYRSNGLGIDLAFSGSPVTEPGTLALFGFGLAALARVRRRRKTV